MMRMSRSATSSVFSEEASASGPNSTQATRFAILDRVYSGFDVGIAYG